MVLVIISDRRQQIHKILDDSVLPFVELTQLVIQGTTKPTGYHLLWDDNKVNIKNIQIPHP